MVSMLKGDDRLSNIKKVFSRLGAALHRLYRYHYGVGLHAMRLCRRVKRRLSPGLRRLSRRLMLIWRLHVGRPVHRQVQKLKKMFAAFPHAFKELREAGIRQLLPCFGRLAKRAIKHYRDELLMLWRLTGPVMATAVLLITFAIWSNTEFCLSLTYAGQDLGYIQSENAYSVAAQMATDRVVNVDNTFSVEAAPILSVTVQGRRPMLSDNELCDAILRTAGDSIAEATGLYVDGNFVGAMESGKALENLLEDIQEGHYDKKDVNQRAEFVQAVETVDGLFPIQSVVSADTLKNKLTSQAVVKQTYIVQAGDTLSTIAVKHDMTTRELRALNPSYANTDMVRIGDELTIRRPQSFLQVKVIKTISYTETIDYKTQYINNNNKPVTYSVVKTRGQEGSQVVTAEVTYVDGVESGRKTIATTVTKQPVTKVVERGTKRVVSSGGTLVQQGDGVTTGSMLWPVPICHNMSRGYFAGHYALDIANGPVTVRNKPCVAADGGTVVYAGWYYGYGNYVKIQHANGLQTAYAHLNSISVVKGQQVSRGQQVGLIGNTGNSFGPHLHFEVIRNGVRVNPLNYVRP